VNLCFGGKSSHVGSATNRKRRCVWKGRHTHGLRAAVTLSSPPAYSNLTTDHFASLVSAPATLIRHVARTQVFIRFFVQFSLWHTSGVLHSSAIILLDTFAAPHMHTAQLVKARAPWAALLRPLLTPKAAFQLMRASARSVHIRR
jgi:hypothetical protein